MVFQAGFQPASVILAEGAREAFSIAAEVPQSADIFCRYDSFFILRHTGDGQLSNECRKQSL